MIVINLAAILLVLESNCFKNDKLNCRFGKKKKKQNIQCMSLFALSTVTFDKSSVLDPFKSSSCQSQMVWKVIS